MAAHNKQMADLMGQHRAIRTYMKFLIDSLDKLAAPSCQVKDRIWRNRLGLYDFRDGVRLHINVDGLISKDISNRVGVAETLKENEEILKKVDGAIRLAEHAFNLKLNDKELNESSLKIREVFSDIRELIEAHIAKEDTLLKLVQKNYK